MSPRLDLTGKQAKPADAQADAYFLNRLNGSVAAQIMGSRAKLELVVKGQSAEDVFNLTQQPAFKLKKIGDVPAAVPA